MDIPNSKKVEVSSEDVQIASWNRPRSTEELRSFIERHHDSRLSAINLE